MEACVSRFNVNIYSNVLRKIYIRSTRCLCTKKGDESSPGVTLSGPDAKAHQTTSTSNEDAAGSAAQSETDRSSNSSQVTKAASRGDEDKGTQAKLLSVLSELKIGGIYNRSTIKLNLARPPKRLGKKKDVVAAELKKFGYGRDVVNAVKAVASSLGGDVEKTEQELVQSFTSIDKGIPIEEPKENSTESTDSKEEPKLDENMVSAIRDVASVVAGDPKKTESELTRKLLSMAAEGSFQPAVMSEVVEGMRVDKKKAEEDTTRRSHSMRTTMHRMPVAEAQVDIFNVTPLNIFKLENKDSPQEAPQLMIWDELQKKELTSLVHYSPDNPFEEMIEWTEQGKFWTFPINNEAGMYEEENVGFHEHVFLDHLLEGFPKKGPIRYFMDLVITGLSKNPYITIQRKAEHVEWYRKYFLVDNKEILQQYEEAC